MAGELPAGFQLDEHAAAGLPSGFELDEAKFGTPGQQAITGLEGAAQGLAGPLAPYLETHLLGVDPQAIRIRAETNPMAHGFAQAAGFGAGMLTGVGEAAAVGKAGEAVAQGLRLGQEGAGFASHLAAGAAKAATEMGLLQASDEGVKAITQDPAQTVGSAVSNIGLSALLGGVGGLAAKGVGTAAKMAVDSDMLQDFSGRLAARGAGVESGGHANFDPFTKQWVAKEAAGDLSMGARLADAWYDKVTPESLGSALGEAIGGVAGHAVPGLGGFGGAYIGKDLLGPVFGSIIKPIMEKGINLPGYQQAMAFGKAILKGNSEITKSAADVFSSGAKSVPQHLFSDSGDREKLDEQIQRYQNDPAGLMEVAGEVGHYMPGHATAIGQTAANAVNYLNSIRPKNPQLSPLDTPLPPSKDRVAQFNRALDIAQHPLGIMEHIKQATLLPHDITTLQNLYPALYPKLAQELQSAMTDHISNGKTVPYRLRQSLSQFLGQPLDSTMTPGSIQSIQASFAAKRPQPSQPGASPKKSTEKLSKIADQNQTATQAREARSLKG